MSKEPAPVGVSARTWALANDAQARNVRVIDRKVLHSHEAQDIGMKQIPDRAGIWKS